MEANVNREEIEKKIIDYWCNSTGFNRMCYKCPCLGSKCIGNKGKRWTSCTKRNQEEVNRG